MKHVTYIIYFLKMSLNMWVPLLMSTANPVCYAVLGVLVLGLAQCSSAVQVGLRIVPVAGRE